MSKVLVVLGSRPEVIKTASVIQALKELGVPVEVADTRQHWDKDMKEVFLKEFGTTPDHEMEGPFTLGRAVDWLTSLLKSRPDLTEVVVQGDTNTVLAGTIAAKWTKKRVHHVEAGLRSQDERMIEEHVRKMVDHVSDRLYAPTDQSKENLVKEGVPPEQVTVTGNTGIDALKKTMDSLAPTPPLPGDYDVLTLHRPENVDHSEYLQTILDDVGSTGVITVWFKHPRVSLEGLYLPPTILLRPPATHPELVRHIKHAKVVLTDSGGLQEEACYIGTPCVTIRPSTERPETIEAGSNHLSKPGNIKEARNEMKRHINWQNPYGNGTAGNQTATEIKRTMTEGQRNNA